MNCLTRATNVLNSTTPFQCITKSLHVFSNITSQADVTNRRFAPNDSFQRGGSVPRSLGRNSSNFCIHPEKLKQIIKEKDGQMLCNFFDSDDYKRKVSQVSHKQKQMIFDGTPIGVNDEDVRYEHVLSCAQPVRTRKEYIADKPDAKMSEIKFRYEKERVPKKITIMSAILKKKNDEARKNQIHAPERRNSPLFPVVKKTRLQVKEPPKKYKKVSTILPIYLKKMEKNIERRKQIESMKETRSPYRETAKKIVDLENVDFNKQVLNVRQYQATSDRGADKEEEKEEVREEREKERVVERRNKSRQATLRGGKEKTAAERSRKGALFYPDLKLVEYSDYVPRHHRTWPPKKVQPWPPNKKKSAAKLAPQDAEDPPLSRNKDRAQSENALLTTSSIAAKSATPNTETKKSISEPSTQMRGVARQHVSMKTTIKKQLSFLTKKLMPRRKAKKTKKLSDSTKENLPAISEFDNIDKPTNTSDLNKVRKRNMSTYRSKAKPQGNGLIIDNVLTLYEKVKTGTSNGPLPSETTRYPFETEEAAKKDYSLHGPNHSQTYRIVKDSKRRREAELREQYDGASKCGTEHVRIELVNASKDESDVSILRAEEDNEEIAKRDRSFGRSPISFVDSGKKLIDAAKDKGVSYADAVKENKDGRMFGKRAVKPPMSFADFRKRSSENEELDKGEENRRLGKRITRPPTPFVDFVKKDNGVLYNRAFNRHLVRLPKTTPEGYRILLYSVRDNDPTKMNFSDCIKGFCMYNDCILSEDGLQEGYIVIFDMKGVQIGHLARVSLPALRCFLLYIQEAHPCRLKTVHVINTASWIHHIMRLIVPLVKSEILNLVKFHKGNIPEGFPQELLPMDLGGDAPTIDELDRETKSLIHKYRDWLIETEEFKSDESKRLKKAGWWGFFGGSNKANDVELDEKTILKNLQVD